MKLEDDHSAYSSSNDALTEMFDSNKDDDSETKDSLSSRSNSLADPSRLKLDTLSFMFPQEKQVARVKHMGKARKKKQSIKFANLAEFFVYDPDKLPYGKEGKSWVNFCPVFLLVDHSFDYFEKDFENLNPLIYSDQAAAEKYWKRIMLRGTPQLLCKSDLDTPLNHRSLLYRKKSGIVPLLSDLDTTGLTQPTLDERQQSSCSLRSIVSKDYSKAEVLDLDNDDLFDDDGVEDEFPEEQITDNVSVVTEENVGNVYIQITRMTELDLETQARRKIVDDLKGLAKHAGELGPVAKKFYGKDMPLDILAREKDDAMYVRKISRHFEEKQIERDVFSDELFGKLFARFITVRQKLKAFQAMKLTQSFRKAFSSPVLNKDSVDFESFKDQGLKCIDTMFNFLKTESGYIEELEKLIKQRAQSQKPFGVGVQKETEVKMIGKIVCYRKDEEKCYDFFTGVELGIKDKGNLQGSKLIFRSPGKKRKRKSKDDPLARVPDILEPPDIILPIHFTSSVLFLRNPLKKWNYIKTKFMEVFVQQINTGVISALLNNNVHLLKYLVEFKFPRVVEETSLLNAESYYALGQSRSKESLRTAHMYKVLRTARQEKIETFHWDYDYCNKAVAPSHYNLITLANFESMDVYVDAMSTILNPLVRADLFISRRRHACDLACSGHKGVLLSILIKMGNFDMVDYLVSHGVDISHRFCTGNIARLRWDLPETLRIREKRKKQDEQMRNKRKEEQSKKNRKLRDAAVSRLFKSSKNLAPTPKKIGEISDEAKERHISDDDADKLNSDMDTIQADEIEMVHRQQEKPAAEVIHEKAEKKQRKQEILRQKSLRTAVSSSGGKQKKKRSPKKFTEADVLGVNAVAKTSLVSIYQQQTPLVVAVEFAVADIYAGRKTIKADKNKEPKLEEQAHAEIEEMNGRVNLVERMLKGGANVLDCDAAAVRACLPVIEQIAKATKRKVRRQQIANQRVARDWSHINNQTMTPRDRRNMNRRKSKLALVRERFSITSNMITKPKPKMKSSALLNFDKFVEEAESQFRGADKQSFDKRRRFAASLNGFKVLQMITEEAVKRINMGMRSSGASRKYKGKYAAIMVRTILVTEAIKEGKWDIVRFLCPYTVDSVKSDYLEEQFKDLDTYDLKWKVIDPITAEVLKRAIRMIMLEVSHLQIASPAWGLNGVYFILKEYNVTLSKVMMDDLFKHIKAVFSYPAELKAGCGPVLEKLYASPQIQHFLKIRCYRYLKDRVLDNMSLTKPNPTIFNLLPSDLVFNLSEFKSESLRYALGNNLCPIAKVINIKSLGHKNKDSFFADLALYALARKKANLALPTIVEMMKKANLTAEKRSKILAPVFHDLLSDVGVYGMNSELNMMYKLLLAGVIPSLRDCVHCISRLLSCPVIGPEPYYTGEDKLVDLTRFRILDHLAFVLFFKEHASLQEDTFLDIIDNLSKEIPKNPNIWIQGLEHLLDVAYSSDTLRELGEQNEKVFQIREYLYKEGRWIMDFVPEEEKLVMKRIHAEKPPQINEIDMENTQDTADMIGGKSASELL